jgi:ribA/ribD-fused uncharacterized protein
MINSFSGEFDFLSNFTPSEVIWMGVRYPTVEHAYQAAKSPSEVIRRSFAYLSNPGQAKREGRKIQIREDWEEIKVNVMRSLLIQKFNNTELFEKLKATAPHELVEGNWWNDTFWGVCRGVGKNMLGKLLMEIRDGLV